MTTDASPVNRYLLFDRADDFRTDDKILYALRAGRVLDSGKDAAAILPTPRRHMGESASAAFESDLQKRFLIRTLDEVKRGFPFTERQLPPFTPSSTDATGFTNSHSLFSSPVATHSQNFCTTAAEMDHSPTFLDDNEELDARPWDNTGAQATHWSWPIETLYQRYHVVHAIDFGQSTFDVSNSGEVFADRIPSIVSTLLHVIETTLQVRDRSVRTIKAWLDANVGDEDTKHRVLAQVWNPTVLVSVVLINAPRSLEKAVPFTLSRQRTSVAHSGGGAQATPPSDARATTDEGEHHEEGSDEDNDDEEEEEGDDPRDGGGGEEGVPIFPPSHTRFAAFEASGGGTGTEDSTLISGIPVLSRVDARRLLQDTTVVERLRETLLLYENTCRQRAKQAWPESNLSATLEYLVRTAPEASAECHSIVLTTNTRSMYCSDTLAFLENVVRRKNLIISVVTLNRLFAIDSPRLSPLAQFLSSVGGFAVQLDYWLSLAATRLNSDWCQRFEGARCLAQQLFVHLVNHFPMASYGITQRQAVVAEHADRTVLYDSEKVLHNMVVSSTRSTLHLLRSIATARFNEGWCVLIDYRDEDTAAHLVARAQHCFHRGALVLHYEMDINRPAVYRRLLVSGTRALVDHFCRLRLDELAASPFSESAGSWFAYLAILRLQVHSWIRAEQTLLELLNMEPRTTPALVELPSLTSYAGVMAEWLNVCCVSSVGLFTSAEAITADTFPGRDRAAPSPVTSTVAAATTLVRRVLARQHRQVLGEEDMAFVHSSEEGPSGPLLYVIQCFPFMEEAEGEERRDTAGVAGGLELRVSFLLCARETQERQLLGLIESLRAGVEGEERLASGAHRLRVDASLTLANQQALLLVVSTMSPRRMELLSFYSEGLAPLPGSTGAAAARSGGASGVAAPYGSALARPPLAKGKVVGSGFASAAAAAGSTPSAAAASSVLQRTLRAPFVTFPWTLANARSFKWSFTCEDRFDSAGAVAFKILFLRRLHTGSDVLVCYNAVHKAVLRKRIAAAGDCCCSDEVVNVFDVIEGTTTHTAPSASVSRQGTASGVASAWGPDMSFSIYRLATPYKRIQGCLSTPALIEDIAEDVHILTALFSYKLFSRHTGPSSGGGAAGAGADGSAASAGGMGSGGGGAVASGSGSGKARRAALLQQQRALGSTIIKARMDSLFPYVQAERMEVLPLQCSRSLGVNGLNGLRAKMTRLVASMADRHVTVPCSSFHQDVLRVMKLSAACVDGSGRGRSPTSSAVAIANRTRVLVSLLYPIRYHTITLLLIAEKSSEEEVAASTVTVGVAFLDAALLEYGLLRRYCAGTASPPRMPSCAGDTVVVSSIKHIVTSFASLYTARQLIRSLTTADTPGPSLQEDRTRERLVELEPLLANLKAYATEIDVTHLLRAIGLQQGWTKQVDATQLRRAVQKVVSTLTTLDARSFPSRPAVYFPAAAAAGTAEGRAPAWLSSVSCAGHGDNGDAGSNEVAVLVATLPVIFAICVCLERRGGDAGKGGGESAAVEREYFWVSSANSSDAVLAAPAEPHRDECPAEEHDGSGPNSTQSLPTRMVLRVVVKTVAEELLDLCRSPNFVPPPRVVRATLQSMMFRYKPSEMGDPTTTTTTGASTGTDGWRSKTGGGASGSSSRSKPEMPAATTAAAQVQGGCAPADPVAVQGADGCVSVAAMEQLRKMSLDFSHLPDQVERALRALMVDPLSVKAAAFALNSTFSSSCFSELQRRILGGAAAGAVEPSVTGTTTAGKSRDAAGSSPALTTAAAAAAPCRKPTSARSDAWETCLLFTQPSLAVCRTASSVPGLSSLLRDIVAPALQSSMAFQSTVFPVEFTQQATTYRSVDPKEAALDVFRRCVDEDHMCVVAAAREYSYAFVPNAAFFGKRWIVVQMDIRPSLSQSGASILYFDAEEGTGQHVQPLRKPSAVSELLRAHIYTKITQISQLHLLKQLRDSQYANTELVPLNWGNQFSTMGAGNTTNSRGGITGVGSSAAHYPRHTGAAGMAARNSRGDGEGQRGSKTAPTGSGAHSGGSPHSSTPSHSTKFYLRGTDVLRIPIYYKLQQYCHKILNFITNNSTRLELFQIYNREQCFVVADDEEGDIFHYLRLVFVKDLGQSVSPKQPSPQLSPSDRCPEMVVQLFTATSNASIRRPLRKLQDFCYFLAVQELQGHLNYVNSISFNDLVFLQNQPLAPIVIDVTKVIPTTSVSRDDVQLALSLLFLNLRENKFKLLDFQDGEQSHTRSIFVRHYILDGEGKGTESSGDRKLLEQQHSQSPNNEGGGEEVGGLAEATRGATKQRTMRFVKVVDGSTDVLCSCALRWCEKLEEADAHLLYLDRYLTKVPSERYINGESERAIMKQLSDLVSDTEAQLAFHAQSRERSPTLVLPDMPSAVEGLLSIAEKVTSAESSLLRFRALSLEDVNPAVYPYLVERLCGAVRPFSPRCCEGLLGVPGSFRPLGDFSWSWMEKQQNDPTTDQKVVYVMCGYAIRCGASEPTSPAALLAETHVLPYSLPELSVTTTTTEEHQMGVLREQNLSAGGPVMPLRIVMKVSLAEGLCIGAFNMRDSEYLLRLLAHIVHEMEEKSWLLHDILLQRLGFAVPSTFTEADLARNCCGDATNVLQGKTLAITGDTYKRRVNNVRFRPHLNDAADDLAVILEGLYNRGWTVNYVFPLEDAIAVLFNERTHYTLQDCESVVGGFVRDGVLVRDDDSALRAQVPLLRIAHGKGGLAAPLQPFNCRLAEIGGVPADALIACDYHRHILATHIIVEAQNARSEVAEVLAECDALWKAGPQDNVLGLAKAVVKLQMKSKQIFGSRVPDFSLRRERWTPEDDILDESLPPHGGGRGPSLSTAVDAAMRSYIHHLRQLYPSLCIIDLDPADPLTTNEEVLLNRLKCRYGKITTESGAVLRFGTHLYYAIIPLVDLLRCKTMHERYGYVLPMLLPPTDDPASPSDPITNSGLFVVEVGFQVVHYALDFFVVNGTNVPLSVAAKVAADFKQSLMFDSILYDSSVQHLQERLRSCTAELPGFVDAVTAAANLVKYYPSPPANSVHVADVFRITDPRVMRLRSLAQSTAATTTSTTTTTTTGSEMGPGNGKEAATSPSRGTSGFMFLVPEKSGKTSLVRSRTGERYLLCGLISWETAQLFVLLSTEKNPSHCARVPNDDLPAMVLQAKRLLLTQLLESTQQERLDAAWEKFLCDHSSSSSDSNSNSGGGNRLEAREGSAAARRRSPGQTATVPEVSKNRPSHDEFELLRSHCQRVVLQSYRGVLQSIVGDVEWAGDCGALERNARVLLPDCVFRILWKPTRGPAGGVDALLSSRKSGANTTSGAPSTVQQQQQPASPPKGSAADGDRDGEGDDARRGSPPRGPPPLVPPASPGSVRCSDPETSQRRRSFPFAAPTLRSPLGLNGAGNGASLSSMVPHGTHSPGDTVGGYDASLLFASSGVSGRVIFTLATNDASGVSFLGMECWSMPGCVPPLVVEDVSFYRKPDGSHAPLSLVTVLSAEEADLLQKLMLLVTNTMFTAIIPCSSQVIV